MEIQTFTPHAFEKYLRHTNEGLQVLRARNNHTVFAADRLYSHATIANECNIRFVEVASAGQISWTEMTNLLTYFTAGNSLGKEYQQSDDQDRVTIGLIATIIEAVGIAQVRTRLI